LSNLDGKICVSKKNILLIYNEYSKSVFANDKIRNFVKTHSLIETWKTDEICGNTQSGVESFYLI